MARKVPPEKLGIEIEKIFKKYADDLHDDTASFVRKIANKGAGALRVSSQNVIGGRYSRSWTYKVFETRLNTEAVIYSKVAGLPHLLEFGHATTNGGRVAGRPHVKPVEEMLNEEFLKGIEKLI